MSENDIPCPIWGTPAKIVKDYGGAACIDSPRAGGRYIIEGWIIVSMKLRVQKLDDATKARLTSWLIEQRLLGEEAPLITPETIEDAKRRRNLPLYERANRLLRYLRSIEPSVGKQFWLGREESPGARAWLESQMTEGPEAGDEIDFFLSFLKTKGWIEGPRDRGYKLTVEGYTHLEELEHPATVFIPRFRGDVV